LNPHVADPNEVQFNFGPAKSPATPFSGIFAPHPFAGGGRMPERVNLGRATLSRPGPRPDRPVARGPAATSSASPGARVGEPVVFAIDRYDWLARQFVAAGLSAGEVDRKPFPDGERYVRCATPVAGRDVVLVGGTVDDAATLDLYDLACGLVAAGARRLTLVVPYFGYATMERATAPGEVVTAKTRARLLSAVPRSPTGNRVLLLDLHSEGIPHYFGDETSAVHLYAAPVIAKAVRQAAGTSDFVLASTDAGRAKWVQSLANDLGVPAAFVLKRRVSGSETELVAVSAKVEGKTVVVYDDMIRTGSSLVSAARAYQAAGAAKLAAVTTHGVFPGDSLAKILSAGVFESVHCTDSHPRARELAGLGLTVHPVGNVFLPYLREGEA
jgi:ribose-phosphate pyrophosphokinase